MGLENGSEVLSRRMGEIKTSIKAALPEIIGTDTGVTVIWYGSAARDVKGIDPEGDFEHQFSPGSDGDLLVSPTTSEKVFYMRNILVDILEENFPLLDINVIRLKAMDSWYDPIFRIGVLKKGIKLVDKGKLVNQKVLE